MYVEQRRFLWLGDDLTRSGAPVDCPIIHRHPVLPVVLFCDAANAALVRSGRPSCATCIAPTVVVWYLRALLSHFCTAIGLSVPR